MGGEDVTDSPESPVLATVQEVAGAKVGTVVLPDGHLSALLDRSADRWRK